MNHIKHILVKSLPTVVALAVLAISMGGTWQIAGAGPTLALDSSSAADSSTDSIKANKPPGKAIAGKLNLNTASEDQLMLLPTVGPAKAERIVAWRKKNGGFKRIADLRRVKGFGYKTFKRLAPFLTIKGETTLATQ